MFIVSEQVCEEVVSRALAFDAVQRVFGAMAAGEARNFPVVREDAKVLGMVGAGHQSQFQLGAAVEQRDFEKVVVWNPHPEMLPRLVYG